MLSPFQGNDFSQGDSLGAYTKKDSAVTGRCNCAVFFVVQVV